MYKRKKIYVKLYGKYINASSKAQQDMFDYYKKMYEEKLLDPEFNVYVEKSRLTQSINSCDVHGSLGIYVSGYASLGTFILGILISKYSLLSLSLGIFILLAGIISASIMKKASLKTDIWNTALIALDAAYSEYPARQN
ncbi:hypothetical protein [Clostridium sp. JN-9]|uniref:hypothetical protein n=1 Tax=Clostridium sp. JN-9 TaxID=2507159 RepID=UPI000FFE1C8A|nr:hypothetical protein [Clostridium sp. JN-9]QAT39813.1 hypothetical protein EQM05_05855 [Clostridium sp. JN-9]